MHLQLLLQRWLRANVLLNVNDLGYASWVWRGGTRHFFRLTIFLFFLLFSIEISLVRFLGCALY